LNTRQTTRPIHRLRSGSLRGVGEYPEAVVHQVLDEPVQGLLNLIIVLGVSYLRETKGFRIFGHQKEYWNLVQ
jgi:hypothetical protein